MVCAESLSYTCSSGLRTLIETDGLHKVGPSGLEGLPLGMRKDVGKMESKERQVLVRDLFDAIQLIKRLFN